MCKFCVSEGDVIHLIKQLCSLLEGWGLHLTKFLSNSKTVLDSVPPEELAPELKLNSGLPVHKALGVYLDASSDERRVRVGTDRRSCTGRGLLSMVSQTYDPLGVVQPFLLPARQLVQQACDPQLGWDQGLSEIPGLQLEWDRWIKSLAELEQIRVPRCVVPRDPRPVAIELHNFSDASTVGYSACAYVRVVFADGVAKFCLLMGKSRVAPLKRVSILRLELVAAVIAVKISTMISREVDIAFSKVYFWTDTSVVLRYLCNAATRFLPFVSSRVEFLHTLTAIEQ